MDGTDESILSNPTILSNMPEHPSLIRALGLKEATALNMIDMVGIGPFVVMPLVIKYMNGPQCIAAWIVGALLALVDGSVWAELGARWPKAGGSYVFLRELYPRETWGRLLSFLFIWQTTIQAPLVIASGAIGFAQYAGYLVGLNPVTERLVRAGLIMFLIFILYRGIKTVGKISIFLWIGVIGTILWLVFAGATHFNPSMAFDYSNAPPILSVAFFAMLGQASVKTVYSYLGYYNVCHLGGEIREPERVIPRSIFLSIFGIALLYLAMQLSVLGTIPWQEAKESSFIFSTFIERIYGGDAARIATLLILWIAAASLFAVILGYSRIPFAAAQDGMFFKVFGKVHPTKHFPHVSLLILGLTGLIFSLLFRLSEVISAILAMRIIVQFIAQAVGVILLHRNKLERQKLPWRMWLFPLPALLAVVTWIWLFYSTGSEFALAGVAVIFVGIVIFLVRSNLEGAWPFAPDEQISARH